MLANAVFAGSATWNLNPTSTDWNTAANWTPETVPNDYSDVATFDVSNVTDVSAAAGIQLSGITFNADASAYTITILGNVWGSGITNNSGVTQNIVVPDGMSFQNTATAGSDVVITALPSEWTVIAFVGNANAGSATIIISGSAAGQYAAESDFWFGASAANSTIINEAGDAGGGLTTFRDETTAANSTITTYAGALVEFTHFSTAASATLIADGGTISLSEHSNGDLAQVELMNGGVLDINRPRAAPTTIGSLAGDSTSSVLLRQSLSIGGNGQNTTFAGVISKPGSLTKIGDETLTLTGANTYGGSTTIQKGALLVQARSGSAISRGPVQVNGGTLGGKGSIDGAVTVGTGNGPGAYLSPGTKGPDTLTINKTLTFKADGSYRCDLSLGQAKADEVIANGVTIESGAQFVKVPKGNQTLTVGAVFTIISNTETTPIGGTFANLVDGSIITAGAGNKFQVSYEGGDGNDLTLTVVP